MKTNEKFYEEDGKLVQKRSYDFSDTLKEMENVRKDGIIGLGGDTTVTSDSRFVGRIPLALVESWCKEAGVKWDDTHARSEVIKKKILSGDFDKFRSDWRGRY